MAYKTRNNYSSHSLVTYKGNQFNLDMMVKVNKESYDNYPYMDTFAEFLNGVLYNNPDSDNGGYKLTDTDGGKEDSYYSEFHDGFIRFNKKNLSYPSIFLKIS